LEHQKPEPNLLVSEISKAQFVYFTPLNVIVLETPRASAHGLSQFVAEVVVGTIAVEVVTAPPWVVVAAP